MVPLYLGIKAVIVKSFARIHCANLVNAGILPLVFKNPDDYDTIDQMDNLEIIDVKSALKGDGVIKVRNITKGIEYEVEAPLSKRQKEIIMAGGLLSYTKIHSK